jgi:hypothetical protein
MDDFLAKKRPVPVLAQDNHERWFKLLERYFKGEGIWAAVIGAPMTDREGFEKADAKAQYIIDICIGDMDRERVNACQNTKEMWDVLLKKYSDKRPSVGRQYLHELVAYRRYKCFACKGEHKWRQCPFIEDHMDEIRKILIKARSDRRGKDRAYAAMDLELSSEDSAVSSDEEITGARLECESPLPQWIADTGITSHLN